MTTTADARGIHDGVPNCQVTAVDGAKHLAPAERAAFVNRRLIDHLSE